MRKLKTADHLSVIVVSLSILTISSMAIAETQGIATTKRVDIILEIIEIKNGTFLSPKSEIKLETAFLKFFILSSF